MKAQDFIEGLLIIQKYKPEGKSDRWIHPEHDEIFVGELSWPIPEEDRNKLKELGFYESNDVDSFSTIF